MTTEEVLLKYFSIQGLWKINPSTGLIDVNGEVWLREYTKVTALPIKFGKITGPFVCRNNKLESLEGSPTSVKSFHCDNNPIESLAGATQSVDENFDCSMSATLISLRGAPTTIKGDFSCSNNPVLESLAGGPQSVGGDFWCQNNRSLKSLTGAPDIVGGNFRCNGTKLESLDGLPKIIRRRILLTYTPTLPLLKLFMVKELKEIAFWEWADRQKTPDAQEVQSILNQYISLGVKGMLPCAAELLKAGYKDNARL